MTLPSRIDVRIFFFEPDRGSASSRLRFADDALRFCDVSDPDSDSESESELSSHLAFLL